MQWNKHVINQWFYLFLFEECYKRFVLNISSKTNISELTGILICFIRLVKTLIYKKTKMIFLSWIRVARLTTQQKYRNIDSTLKKKLRMLGILWNFVNETRWNQSEEDKLFLFGEELSLESSLYNIEHRFSDLFSIMVYLIDPYWDLYSSACMYTEDMNSTLNHHFYADHIQLYLEYFKNFKIFIYFISERIKKYLLHFK